MSDSLTAIPGSPTGLFPQAPAATAAPNGNNLLQMLQGFTGLRQANNENAQFQQQFAARQAMGPILQQSVGPDGQIDYAKATTLMAQNPATAWAASDFANQAVARQKTQADTIQTNLKNALDRTGYINSSLSSLLSMPGGPTITAALGKVAEARGAGILSNDQATQIASTLPQDPMALTQHLKQQMLTGMQAHDAMTSVYGSLNTRDIGGKNVVTADNPFMGTSNVLGGNAGVLGKGPTPDKLATPLPYMDPKTNQPMMTTIGGANQVINQNGPQAVGAGPQMTQYLKGEGPIAKMESDINDEAGTANRAIQQGLQIKNLIAQVGQAGGAGAEVRSQLAGVAKSMGVGDNIVAAITGGSNADVLNATQELQKLYNGQAWNVARTLAGSNHITGGEMEGITNKGSPNVNMTPQAQSAMMDFILKTLNTSVGQLQAWNQYKKTPEFQQNPTGFPAKWSEALRKHNYFINLKPPAGALVPDKAP